MRGSGFNAGTNLAIEVTKGKEYGNVLELKTSSRHNKIWCGEKTEQFFERRTEPTNRSPLYGIMFEMLKLYS